MRVCVHKDECVHVYVSVCVCTVFRKKKSGMYSVYRSMFEGEKKLFGHSYRHQSYIFVLQPTSYLEKAYRVTIPDVANEATYTPFPYYGSAHRFFRLLFLMFILCFFVIDFIFPFFLFHFSFLIFVLIFIYIKS